MYQWFTETRGFDINMSYSLVSFFNNIENIDILSTELL